ncbi:MAG TPA: Rpn family recombination-promoting nuclease/putative transposase [Polyangiaceae bacterium]
MERWLDPTLDVVFKMLLLRDQTLLRDMIEAVLVDFAPIRELVVLNPEIPKDFPGDKSIVLDIRASFDDGHLVDLEMQSSCPAGTKARFLYYWARNFMEQLGRGGDYSSLRPCVSILWLKLCMLESQRFHTTFHLSEDQTREVLSSEIEFHVLELPKLHLASVERRTKLERWAQFLSAQTEEELRQLAQEDSIMNTAKDILEVLSADPAAQQLARDREMSLRAHHHLIASSREQGRAEGRVATLERLLMKRFGPLPPALRERLHSGTIDELDAWADRVLTAESIEAVF